MPGPGTALVVGASHGLGLGVVAELLHRGWDVVATVRAPSAGLDALAGERLRVEQVDIDHDDEVAALRGRLEGLRFDLLFVVAGVATGAGTPVPQMAREMASRVFQTNAISPIRFAEAFHMQVASGGTIALERARHGGRAGGARGRQGMRVPGLQGRHGALVGAAPGTPPASAGLVMPSGKEHRCITSVLAGAGPCC